MIVTMKRLSLIAMKNDEDKILKALQELEAVEIISNKDCDFSDESFKYASERKRRLQEAYKAMQPFSKKPGILEPTPEATREELNSSMDRAMELCAQAERLNGRLLVLQSDAQKLTSSISALLPWEKLSTPIPEICSTRTVRFFTGTIKREDFPKIENIGGAALEVYEHDSLFAVIAACANEDGAVVQRALKDGGFMEYSFPQADCTAGELIRGHREKLGANRQEQEDITQELKKLGEEQKLLGGAVDSATIDCDREQAKLSVNTTYSTFLLEGWVVASDAEKVAAAVNGVTSDCYIEYSDPGEDETPPTVVKNGRITSAFEAITNMFSRPAYNGVDAAKIVTPFYLLFFGMMLSDTGYGLLLFIGTALFIKYKKPKGNFASVVRLLKYCGLSTVICGFFIGTFFGMSWQDIFGANSFLPILFDPMQHIMEMVYICCGLGLFQMMVGLGIKMYMCIRDGDYKSAIFDNLSWMMLVLGLVAMLVFPQSNVPAIVAAAGGVMILFFKNRTTKNIIKRIGSGLGSLYSVSGYIGDTLSYMRVLALGLVTGAMGMVFNMIGTMIYSSLSGTGIVGAIIGAVLAGAILIFFHSFSLFINVLGTYVHCARLQFVEFFGKFYEPNGLEFKPLGYNTKHVNIK